MVVTYSKPTAMSLHASLTVLAVATWNSSLVFWNSACSMFT